MADNSKRHLSVLISFCGKLLLASDSTQLTPDSHTLFRDLLVHKILDGIQTFSLHTAILLQVYFFITIIRTSMAIVMIVFGHSHQD